MREIPSAARGQSVRPGKSVLGMMVASQTSSGRAALCTHCHAREPAEDRTKCAECLETIRERERATREHRRRNRLCLTCGAAAEVERHYCAAHLAWYAERQKTKGLAERTLRRTARRILGQCTNDGCPERATRPGAPYCAAHLAQMRDWHRAERARKGG